MTATVRQWAPDPTGRHPYRSHLNGEWTDLVAQDVGGAGISTDTAGGRLARSAAPPAAQSTAPQRPKSDPLAVTFDVLGVLALFGGVWLAMNEFNKGPSIIFESQTNYVPAIAVFVGGLLSFVVARFARSIDR